VAKLGIVNEMAQFDLKNRGFYDSLSAQEKKDFKRFFMIRWGSSVQGDGELAEYYLRSTNERLNKHFFAINRHPKLQWLCATAVSPGLGTQRHTWIAPKKKEPGAGSLKKQLADLFPNRKADEIELLAAITTKKELDAYNREHGDS